MAVAKGSLSQMLNAFEDKLEDLEGNDIESSTDVFGTMYEDLDGSTLGEIGAQASYEELKNLYEELHDSDPIVHTYDSFEEWLSDTEENGFIRMIESSFDYPDDLEDLENGEYESHMTEPVNASVPTKPEFDILEKSTIEASDEDEFDSWLEEFESALRSEVIGTHTCVDEVEFEDDGNDLIMTVDYYKLDEELDSIDFRIPYSKLTQDIDLIQDDVGAAMVDVDMYLDEFDNWEDDE